MAETTGRAKCEAQRHCNKVFGGGKTQKKGGCSEKINYELWQGLLKKGRRENTTSWLGEKKGGTGYNEKKCNPLCWSIFRHAWRKGEGRDIRKMGETHRKV